MITKITLPLLAAMLSVACVLTGCQSPKAGSPLIEAGQERDPKDLRRRTPWIGGHA
jgi:hypothetical protein